MQANESLSRARALLARAVPGLGEPAQAELAVELAHALLAASQSLSTSRERTQARRLSALMDDEQGQAFATALTDRVHRSKSGANLVRQVRSLLAQFGVPRSLQHVDRLELRALKAFGASVPELSAAAVRRRIYMDASPYIVPADSDALAKYLRSMQTEDVRVNVNHLGEEVLGEREAEKHLAAYLDLLERPEVSTISVKISSLYSQLTPLAWEACLSILRERLQLIYRAAQRGPNPRLVYLDMESYRDLEMTARLFTELLVRDEFLGLTAGIVLQAYVPDSVRYQQELTQFAVARVARGGAPIRIRLVKGANLAMERLEASHRNWALATYDSKVEVDANYKRLLFFGCQPEHARAVTLGIASHNLFDLSLALIARRSSGVEDRVELEMLEGMAQSLRRAVQTLAGGVLVYAPSVDERNFPAAVAYLVRRLDENTAEDNFLRHSFGMRPGDANFQAQAELFLEAFRRRHEVSSEPKRGVRGQTTRAAAGAHFQNQPDTDFTNAGARQELFEALERVKATTFEVPLQIAGSPWLEGPLASGFDPSRPESVPYRHALATPEVLELAVKSAVRSAKQWAAVPADERSALLLRVAQALRGARNELIAHMVLDAGKRVEEADTEVSEAIDFAEYYARQFLRLAERFETRPKGVILVTPPWNFPLAIPASGVFAALVAGNAVLLKPAPETLLVAATLVRLCHAAGIPESVLQFVACDDSVGSRLISDERVDCVVLTGATQTAQLFQRLRPGLDLLAETGGKNAIYISDLADVEQACRHVVRSAFGHAGQKCSACSLLVVHRDVYNDEAFRAQLLDASRSLPVGSAWDVHNVVTPLIHPPRGPLARAIEQLEQGEQWLLEPRRDPENARLVAPGIKWNVRPGSFTHLTELFGPVLAVLPARSLKHAVGIINETSYGLTSGIQSLDGSECWAFADAVEAGNIYANLPITGAVVGRQPFGGRKASGFGPGAKAGGPNYVAQFCHLQHRRSRVSASVLSRGPRAGQGASIANPDSAKRKDPHCSEFLQALNEEQLTEFKLRIRDYEKAYSEEFARYHPQDSILGVHCLLRYRACRVLLYLTAKSELVNALCCLSAARLAGASLVVKLSDELAQRPEFGDLSRVFSTCESTASLRELVMKQRIERVRVPGVVPQELLILPQQLPVTILGGPPEEFGYAEVRKYLSEQALSLSHHRHGHLSQPTGLEQLEKGTNPGSGA